MSSQLDRDKPGVIGQDGGEDDFAAQAHAGKTFRIAFIHPDLGIGGAERLVVDAAVGLQDLGHEVDIITSYHDPQHCFEPTRDGTLKVHRAETAIPRHLGGALHLPLAIARQMSLVFQLLLALFAFRFHGTIPGFVYKLLSSLSPMQGYDVFIVDQLSACVPILRIFTTTRVIFYCHYPDKDVGSSIARQKAIERGQSGPGILRALYRVPFDFLEEMTMSTADKIMVNSEFTSRQFQKTFFRLARIPRVVYPGIDPRESSEAKVQKAVQKLEEDENGESGTTLPNGVPSVKSAIRTLIKDNARPTLVSVNRFEAKKNIALAVETFSLVQKMYAAQGHASDGRLRLILAGGYDHRLNDNIATLKELQSQCDKLGLTHSALFYNRAAPHESPASAPSERELANASVIFLPSVPYALLTSVLMQPSTRVLLYTPTEEHFGIVPLEAMAVGLPVLATNTGGPMESVLDLQVRRDAYTSEGESKCSPGKGLPFANDNGTGLLRRAKASLWAQATWDLLCLSHEQRAQVAGSARARVNDKFSRRTMSREFERCVRDIDAMGPVRSEEGLIQWSIAATMFVLMMGVFLVFVRYANAKQHDGLNVVRVAQQKLEAQKQAFEASRAAFESARTG